MPNFKEVCCGDRLGSCSTVVPHPHCHAGLVHDIREQELIEGGERRGNSPVLLCSYV